jgi:hypothetical protein
MSLFMPVMLVELLILCVALLSAASKRALTVLSAY